MSTRKIHSGLSATVQRRFEWVDRSLLSGALRQRPRWDGVRCGSSSDDVDASEVGPGFTLGPPASESDETGGGTGLPKLGTRSSAVSRSPETELQSPEEARGVVHECRPTPALRDGLSRMGPEDIVERCRYEGMEGGGILLAVGERIEVLGLVPGRK